MRAVFCTRSSECRDSEPRTADPAPDPRILRAVQTSSASSARQGRSRTGPAAGSTGSMHRPQRYPAEPGSVIGRFIAVATFPGVIAERRPIALLASDPANTDASPFIRPS